MGDDVATKRLQLINSARGPHDRWARDQYEKDKGAGSCKKDSDLAVPCPGDRLLTFGVFSPMKDLDFGDDARESKLEYYTWFNRKHADAKYRDVAESVIWPDEKTSLGPMKYADLNEDVRPSVWANEHRGAGPYTAGDSGRDVGWKGDKRVPWTLDNYRLAMVERAVNQDRSLGLAITKWQEGIKCATDACALQIHEGDPGDPYKPNAWDYVARNTNISIAEGADARTRVAVCIRFFATCTLKHGIVAGPTKRLDLSAHPGKHRVTDDESATDQAAWRHIISASLTGAPTAVTPF